MKMFGHLGLPANSPSTGALSEFSKDNGCNGEYLSLGGPADGIIGSCFGPSVGADATAAVVVAGRPRLAAGGPQDRDAATTVLRAYRQHGHAFLTVLRDQFALALVDKRTGCVTLAVDRMGVQRLTFCLVDGGLVFSDSAMQIARLTHVRATCVLRPQALFDYLMMHMVPGPQTVFEGISKLQAGTCAVFDRGGLKVSRYWQPEFVEATGDRFDSLSTALHESLAAAVARCEPDDKTGAFLSGGLDSSTVAGVLGQVTRQSPRTFSMGFGVAEYDELEFARIAAKHFKAAATEYQLGPADIVDAFPRIASAYDEPFGNSSAVPTFVCAKVAAAHGITHLLAGDGGDEIFGGNSRYVQQKKFELYRLVPALLRRGLIEPGTRLIDPESRVTLLRKLRSYVDQARIDMPERGEYWNLLYRSDFDTFLDDDFRLSIDRRAQLANMLAVYEAAPSRNLVHQMLFYDWQFTLADNDLRKVSTMCELNGVRVSYPMLDSDVVDLSIRIPPDKKIDGHELRSFYKRAMRDFLPREILEKKKHGFGLPFGVWLKADQPLADLVYGLLGDLKRRRIVRPEFLDQLIDDHRAGHASYFGYAIWDLAMLEAWLATHSLSVT